MGAHIVKRLENWETNLQTFVRRWQSVPFEWGQADCAAFAADAVYSVTGEDVRAKLGAYINEAEADHLLAWYGGLEAAVDEIVGERKPTTAVRRGDLVLLTDRVGGALGVVTGVNAHALTKSGLRGFPPPFYRLAWGVG